MKASALALMTLCLVGALTTLALGHDKHHEKKAKKKSPFERIMDRFDDLEARIAAIECGGGGGDDDAVLDAIAGVQSGVTALGDGVADLSDDVAAIECDCLAPWNRTLADGDRFELCLNDEAVLDNETGLVWVRRPRKENLHWVGVKDAARKAVFGNRAGWRVPTFEELATLVDVDAWIAARDSDDLDANSIQTMTSSSLFDLQDVPAGRIQFATDTHDDSTEGGANDFVWYLEFTGTESQSHFPLRYSPLTNRGGYVWYVRGGSSYNGHEGGASD